MSVSENLFKQSTLDEEQLVKKYFEHNQLKKETESWLKQNKPKVEAILEKYGKNKMDFGDLRVSVVVPDASKFDENKVVDFCIKNNLESCLKYTVNEEALGQAIESNTLDVDALKEFAWIEAKGSPRLNIKKLVEEE